MELVKVSKVGFLQTVGKLTESSVPKRVSYWSSNYPSSFVSLVFIRQKQSKEEGRITVDDHENFRKKDYDKYLLLGLWQVMSFSFVSLVFFS